MRCDFIPFNFSGSRSLVPAPRPVWGAGSYRYVVSMTRWARNNEQQNQIKLTLTFSCIRYNNACLDSLSLSGSCSYKISHWLLKATRLLQSQWYDTAKKHATNRWNKIQELISIKSARLQNWQWTSNLYLKFLIDPSFNYKRARWNERICWTLGLGIPCVAGGDEMNYTFMVPKRSEIRIDRWRFVVTLLYIALGLMRLYVTSHHLVSGLRLPVSSCSLMWWALMAETPLPLNWRARRKLATICILLFPSFHTVGIYL